MEVSSNTHHDTLAGPAYKYQPLVQGAVRVLEYNLQTKDSGQCHFKHDLLACSPQYDAISYIRGTE
jgi:hypothetical protein